jgi:hypothetical protein
MESDWSRFKIHAKRVRAFETSSLMVDEESLQALRVMGSQPLLPQVREISWYSIKDLPFIHLVLGPQTRKLVMPLEQSSAVQMALLSTLKYQYPGLTHVDIISPDIIEDILVDDAIEDALCGWNQLRNLHIDLLSLNALAQIAILPVLEHLKLFCSKACPTDFPRCKIPGSFPSLKTLRVQFDEATFCKALLATILPIPTLSSIEIQAFGAPGWRDFFQVMSLQCHSSITHIKFDDFMSSFDDMEHLVTVTHLRPILAFTNVTHALLRLDGAIHLDDESIKEIVMAWPRVISLTLFNTLDPEPNKSSRLTLWSLVAFAQYSPHLQYLQLHIDAKEVPDMLLSELVFNKSLVGLHVAKSPIRNPPSVAAFLSDIFPALKSIKSHSRSDYKDKWNEVQRVMGLFLSARVGEGVRIRQTLRTQGTIS